MGPSPNCVKSCQIVQIALDLTENEKWQLDNMEVDDCRGLFCPIVGCGARLKYLEEFEDHFNSRQNASCSVCSRYECLVESCGVKLKSYKSRQQHLVDKHKFPTSFEFLKQSRPSKKGRQKNQRKQALKKGEASTSAMLVEEEIMDGLVSAVSKLSTSDSSSPSSVIFGRRHTRGIAFVARSVQRERRPDSDSDSLPAGIKR